VQTSKTGVVAKALSQLMSHLLSLCCCVFSILFSIGIKEYLSFAVIMAVVTFLYHVWVFRFTISWTFIAVWLFKTVAVPSLVPFIGSLLWEGGTIESAAVAQVSNAIRESESGTSYGWSFVVSSVVFGSYRSITAARRFV